ncbi:MAG: GHKL domain-containing protein [Clostridia bacterium]|nr:GHKL domain-containing protein [Clostridia bacterium]
MDKAAGILMLFIGSIIFMSCVGIMLLELFRKETKLIRVLLFGAVTGGVLSIIKLVTLDFRYALNFTVGLLTIIMSIYHIFKIKLWHSLLGTFIFLMLCGLNEYLLFFSLKKIIPWYFETMDFCRDNFFTGIFNLGIAFMFILIAMLIKYFKISFNFTDQLNSKKIRLLIVNILLSIFLITPNMLFFFYSGNKIPLELGVFNLILVAAIITLSLYNTMNKGELELSKQQLELQKMYIASMEEVLDTLRGIRHNFGNMVQTMGGYLALNDLEGLKEYYKQMMLDTNYNKSAISFNQFLRSSPGVFGLVTSKLEYAEEKNVCFTVNVITNFDKIKLKDYDLCKILGILLDNAIEAAAEGAKRHVELFAKPSDQGEGIIIKISNTFSQEVDVQKIFGKGFSSKPDHSGMGLWEVRKMLGRCDGCKLDTYIAGDMFTHVLKIDG